MKKKIISLIKYIDGRVDIRRFIKFGITGFMNTAVDFGVYALCNEVFRFPYTWTSQFFAMTAAMANSFIVNKLWTFGKTKRFELGELGRFLIVNSVSLGLSTFSVYILCDAFAVNKYLAKIPVAAITIMINYFGNKIFVFKEEKNSNN